MTGKGHRAGLHIEKIPFKRTSVNAESVQKMHSPPLLGKAKLSPHFLIGVSGTEEPEVTDHVDQF